MSTGKVWINETDPVADLGFADVGYRVIAGWGAGMSFDRAATPMPGSYENMPGIFSVAPPRVIRLDLQVVPSAISGRDADLNALADLMTGKLELRFWDSPTKIIEGELVAESSEALDMALTLLKPHLVLPLDIRCYNPTKRDRYIQSVAFEGSRVEVPIGTAGLFSSLVDSDVNPKVYIMGAATNPVLTLRDAGGTSLGTLGFSSLTLGADDYLVIDLALKTITRYDAGVSSSVTSFTGNFFEFEPGYANYRTSAWHTLECSGLTGDGNCKIVYFRAWRS